MPRVSASGGSERLSSFTAFAPPKSGSVSERRKRRMKSTLTMMKIPPAVMAARAARSTRLTRPIPLDAATMRSRTPRAVAAIAKSLLEFGQLFLHDRSREGKVSVLHDHLLAFTAEDELDVLLDERVER